MRIMNTTELSAMEVINLCDGGKLGCPACFEIDCDDGKITALLIPRCNGFSILGKNEYYRIPWCKIQCIGEDTILVKVTANELTSCACKIVSKRRAFWG